MLIAKVAFDMKNLTQRSVGNNPFEFTHARKAALVVAERKWHSGLCRRLDGACGFSAREGKRLFAPDRLARRSDCGNLSHMQGMWCREKDGLHARVGDRVFELGRYLEALGGREITHQLGLLADTANEPQALAFALYRFNDVFSPPAEANDRCVDHEKADEIA